MKKPLVILAAVLTLALSVSACSTGATAQPSTAGAGSGANDKVPDTIQPIDLRNVVHGSMKGKRVAFVPLLYKGYKITQQWGTTMQRVVTMEGGTFSVFDSNFNTDQMIRTIDGLIKGKKADVLVLHNPDVSVLTQQIQDAKAAGIYTVVLNLMSSQTGDAFVGGDTVSASEDISSRAFKDCASRGKKKVAMINGPGTNGFDLLFAKGVKDAAKKQGFEVVAETKSNYQVDLASQQATTLVQTYKSDLCAIILPWDVLAIAAGKSVQRSVSQGIISQGDVGVYSLDASSDGCDAVKSGVITALASYDVPGIGAAAAVVVQNILQLGMKPGSTHTAAYVDDVVFDKSSVSSISTACYTGE